MRLIDADMLLNSFKGAKKLGVDAIKYYVDNTLTIDLVMCRECKHRHEHEWYNTCDKHIGHGFEDNYFCSYGERRK